MRKPQPDNGSERIKRSETISYLLDESEPYFLSIP